MPSSYTRNLGLEKPATGEQAGVWGNTANNDYDLLDSAIDGNQHISIGGGYNLDTIPGAVSQGRNKVIVWTGVLTQNATVNITPNTAEKWYFMQNATSGGFSIIFQQGTGGVFTLAAGASAVIYCDGTGATARVDGALSNPQFGSAVVQGQAANSSLIKTQASDVSNYIQFWKDGTPSVAAAIGLSIPAAGVLTNDLIFSNYTAGAWTEHLRIRADGFIDAHATLTTYQGQIAVSNVIAADYTAAAITIRETNLVQGAQIGNEYAPRITFQWASLVARQLGMDSTGVLAALNGDGTIGDFTVRTLNATTVTAPTINATVTANVTTLLVGAVNATAVTANTVTAPTVTGVTTLNATNWNGSAWNGFTMSSGAPPGANQVIASDAAGSVFLAWINTVSGDSGGAAIARVYASNDSYLRYYTLANFAAQIVPFIPATPQTPWLSPINANNQALSNVGRISGYLGSALFVKWGVSADTGAIPNGYFTAVYIGNSLSFYLRDNAGALHAGSIALS